MGPGPIPGVFAIWQGDDPGEVLVLEQSAVSEEPAPKFSPYKAPTSRPPTCSFLSIEVDAAAKTAVAITGVIRVFDELK